MTASTGQTSEADFLRALGAAEVIDRAELGTPGKPLQKERWAAVVDSVGSYTLVNACAQVRYGGVVAAMPLRETAWKRLAQDLAPDRLQAITREIRLAEAIDAGHKIVDGGMRGRVVVNVNR